jgi:phosphatidylglycerol:prolipoprotein diacylglycerol transferase
VGFVGAKAYYLLERLPNLTWHDLGHPDSPGTAGSSPVSPPCWSWPDVEDSRRFLVAGSAAAPLSAAYGIGRLGCLLRRGGTYGKPSTLPWEAFPERHGADDGSGAARPAV